MGNANEERRSRVRGNGVLHHRRSARSRGADGAGDPWSECSAAEIEAAALAQLGGAKNQALSTAKELRLGAKGSVAVQLTGAKAGAWFDHERRTGGYLQRDGEGGAGDGPARRAKAAA